jgi:hypothetical protein
MELIMATKGASNSIIGIEDATEDEINEAKEGSRGAPTNRQRCSPHSDPEVLLQKFFVENASVGGCRSR